MFRTTAKWPARVLLVASFAMVIETACSDAPPPAGASEPGKVITKIHTKDGTLYVTSRYAVTDSFVVIEEILRGDKYYPDPSEAHLYQKPEAAKRPAKDLDLPVMIPLNQVESIEPWKESHETRNGVLGGALLIVGVAVALMIAFAASPGWPAGGD